MIRQQRASQAKADKVFEAIQYAHVLTNWINEKYPDLKVQMFTGRYGAVGTIYWVVDYLDAGTMDAMYTKLLADEEYRTRFMQGSDLFEGLPQDTVMVSM